MKITTLVKLLERQLGCFLCEATALTITGMKYLVNLWSYVKGTSNNSTFQHIGATMTASGHSVSRTTDSTRPESVGRPLECRTFNGRSYGSVKIKLPHFEMRALAMLGAGLLKRHKGDPKAISKLEGLAVPIDGYRYNLTLKTLASMCEEAAGSPLYDNDVVFLEIKKILPNAS